jgi:hypothetical protein
MLPASSIRAGRELLEWSQADLAKHGGFTVTDLVAFEKLGRLSLGIEHEARAALMRHGIVFLNDMGDGDFGVCLYR